MNKTAFDICTQENVQKLITVLDGLSQKLSYIPSSAFSAINKSINVLLYVFEVAISFIFNFGLIVFGFVIIAKAMIFLKAKRKSWTVVIPFYSDYIIFDIATGKGFLGIIYALLTYSSLFIPIFELLCDFDMSVLKIFVTCISLILDIFMKFKLAKKFNKGIIFGLGLMFMPVIFYPILGFGKSEYKSENKSNIVSKN